VIGAVEYVRIKSVVSPSRPRLQLNQYTESQWQAYLEDFGINLPAKNRHAPCPGCGGTDRFRWHGGKESSFYYHCAGAGDYTHGSAIDLVSHSVGLSFKDQLPKLQKIVGQYIQPAPAKTERDLSKYARAIWTASAPGNVDAHPYAVRKGIDSDYGAARGIASGKLIGQKADCIIVPLRRWETVIPIDTCPGELVAVECINADGAKQTFGKRSGAYVVLGNPLDHSLPVRICEGFASAMSLFKAHRGNCLVVSVGGKGQMNKAAQQIAQMGRDVMRYVEPQK